MSQSLMPVGGLIRLSWDAFLKHWNETAKISLWFLAAPLLYIPVIFMGVGSSMYWYTMLISLAGAVITIWITLRLTIVILAEEKGGAHPSDEQEQAKKMFWAYLWVNFLTGLAVFGGTLLLVFPGIWLSVALGFGRFNLVEDGIHGTQALAASHALVKGRWWATFWRMVVPGLLFTILLMIAIGAVTMIVGAMAGLNKMSILVNSTGTDTPAATAIRYLLQGVGQAVLMPLFIWWPVKLFHNLKATR